MKHLNPRQGITTSEATYEEFIKRAVGSVKHLNPRQGITTRSTRASQPCRVAECETPKSPPGDYNVDDWSAEPTWGLQTLRVKHLNPRQGITTDGGGQIADPRHRGCETPKSPPGDYNAILWQQSLTGEATCETPKSPPGDYNIIDEPIRKLFR